MARNFCSVNYGWVINSMTTFGLLLQQDVTCLSSRLDKIQTEKKHKKNFLLSKKLLSHITALITFEKFIWSNQSTEKSGLFLMDIANIYRNVNWLWVGLQYMVLVIWDPAQVPIPQDFKYKI